MPYPWECIDCKCLDLGDKKWGEYYCLKKRYYVKPNSPSCDKLEKKDTSSTCYLTTIACNILGYEDDAYPLNALRSFRDNYMKNNEEYTTLLEDYNTIAPMICDKIEDDENNTEVARSMMSNYIVPAVIFIDEKRYDTAIDLYECMTLDLMDYYNIDRKPLKGNYRVRKIER